MTRKLFILGLVLAVCLELSQAKPVPLATIMEEYAKALIYGGRPVSHIYGGRPVSRPETLIQGGKATPSPKIMEEALLQGKPTKAPRSKIMEDYAEALLQGKPTKAPRMEEALLQGKPTKAPRSKIMEDYVEALIQGKPTKAPRYKIMEDLAEALIQGICT